MKDIAEYLNINAWDTTKRIVLLSLSFLFIFVGGFVGASFAQDSRVEEELKQRDVSLPSDEFWQRAHEMCRSLGGTWVDDPSSVHYRRCIFNMRSIFMELYGRHCAEDGGHMENNVCVRYLEDVLAEEGEEAGKKLCEEHFGGIWHPEYRGGICLWW